MKQPKVFAYSKKIFNRFYINKAYPNIHLLSAYKENWVSYFDDLKNKYSHIYGTNQNESNKADKAKTENIFEQPEWKEIKHNLKINNLLVYKPFKKIGQIEQSQNLNILCNSYNLFKKLENKITFRKNFSEFIPFPPYRFSTVKKLKEKDSFIKLKNKYGKFVIQDEELSGGWGTYIVNSKKEFNEAVSSLPQKNSVVVSKYIKGESASVQACIYNKQVLNTPMQRQLVGLPALTRRTGQFVGGQWTPGDYSDKQQRKVEEMVKATGKKLLDLDYKGIFGLDIIIEKETDRIYILEMNARMTGVTPIINMIQMSSNLFPFINYHISSFLPNHKQKIPINKHRTSISDSNISYLILTNTEPCCIKLKKELLPGLYMYNKNKIEHQKITTSLADLHNDNQFLLLGIPNKNTKIKQNSKRVIRFIKRGPALKQNNQLNELSKNIVRLIKEKFEKCETMLAEKNK